MYVYQNKYLESTQKLCWFSKVAVIGSLLVLKFYHLQLIYSLQFTVHSLYYRFIGPVIHILILSRLKVQFDNCRLLPRYKCLCSTLRNILPFQSLCGLQVLHLGITIGCFFPPWQLEQFLPILCELILSAEASKSIHHDSSKFSVGYVQQQGLTFKFWKATKSNGKPYTVILVFMNCFQFSF